MPSGPAGRLPYVLAQGEARPEGMVTMSARSAPHLIDDREQRGRSAFGAREYAIAAQSYEEAILMAAYLPTEARAAASPRLHANLAAANLGMGHFDEALIAADAAVAADASHAKAHFRRGRALEGLGRPAEALHAYPSRRRSHFPSLTPTDDPRPGRGVAGPHERSTSRPRPPTDDSRPGRGVAATRRHGISSQVPRRRRVF